MAALGETDDIATLDQLATSVEDLQRQTDTAIYLFQGSDAAPETIVQMASRYEPILWPSFEQSLARSINLRENSRPRRLRCERRRTTLQTPRCGC